MLNFIVEQEPVLRGAAFVGIFVVIALWELGAPRRPLAMAKRARWAVNIAIVILNTAVLRLIFAGAALAVAHAASIRGWGLFNLLDWPLWLEILLAVVLFDFVIYVQHVMFHAVPALWRLHMMHHADLDIDVTTGARFHPLEIVISMIIKIASVAALGPHAAAVVIFEVLLNGTAMFNHGNVRIAQGFDRVLRWFVVTPDMHRVHHSVLRRETNSNFGFNLPWWDRLCGTYRAEPEAGHRGMTIGLSQFRDPAQLTLGHILLLPFRGDSGAYALGRSRAHKPADDNG